MPLSFSLPVSFISVSKSHSPRLFSISHVHICNIDPKRLYKTQKKDETI